MTGLTLSAGLLAFAGCWRTNSTEDSPPNSGTGSTGMVKGEDITGPHRFANTPPSPGGAPNYGTPSGMGFPTGNASQAGGGGSGLMGFHGTGSAGTSGTITDTNVPHPTAAAEAAQAH